MQEVSSGTNYHMSKQHKTYVRKQVRAVTFPKVSLELTLALHYNCSLVARCERFGRLLHDAQV